MHIPSSTYRVQLNQDFSFEELKKVIDYIHELGISTIYAAPIGKATPGSTHGYDVTDPHRINPEVGGKKDLKELYQMMKDKGMNWLQDIVPNHMAFNIYNVRLMDVLERGPQSPYYAYFDINWNHHDDDLKGKVMVPFLGKELSACMNENEIKIAFSDKGFTIDYFENAYPVSSRSITFMLASYEFSEEVMEMLEELRDEMEKGYSYDEWVVKKAGCVSAMMAVSSLKDEIENALTSLNARPDWLRRFLDHQYYVLTFWKETERRINYRRFFTVNSLICLRMGDESVFNEYHMMIARMYEQGFIHGVRIDHIDGLNDPKRYLENLRQLLGDDCYIIAEKILEEEESLPEEWPIQGTSGYEFLSNANKLFTDKSGSKHLVAFYRTLTPESPPYEELVHRNKSLILEKHMAGELDNLVHFFIELGLSHEYELERIKGALAQFMLAFPVYRIYPDSLPLSGLDLKLVRESFQKALAGSPYEEELLYLQKLFINGSAESTKNEKALRFIQRMMQFTGPLTAKGVEDTTFYIYNPLISHDEVGDAPSTLGTSLESFHKKMIGRASENPLSLNATATHDTKRGEDARIRLNVLSKIPDLWISKVKEWMALNERHKRLHENDKAPAVNDEYFIYQSILGGFPEEFKVSPEWVQRLKEYIIKVVREAKVFSSWEVPNTEYESACTGFLDAILQDDSPFLQSFLPLIETIAPIASLYSISQSVVKITAPGIPDIYQGCELWDLSYVDPDNRRPVDYEKRMMLLSQMKEAFNTSFNLLNQFLLDNQRAGVMKFFAIWRSLHFRKDHPNVFTKGAYVPLAVLGEGPRVLGYARYFEDEWCIVIIPFWQFQKNKLNKLDLNRNFISLPANSPRKWRNIFTNQVMEVSGDGLSIADVLADFPVAALCNN